MRTATINISRFSSFLTSEYARDGLGEYGHVVRLPQKCVSASSFCHYLDIIAGEHDDRRLLPVSHRPRPANQLDAVCVWQLMVENQNIIASAALERFQSSGSIGASLNHPPLILQRHSHWIRHVKLVFDMQDRDDL